MCEANAYLIRGDREELVMEAVDIVENEGGFLKMRNIFGEQKRIKGVIRRMALVEHKILIEETD